LFCSILELVGCLEVMGFDRQIAGRQVAVDLPTVDLPTVEFLAVLLVCRGLSLTEVCIF